MKQPERRSRDARPVRALRSGFSDRQSLFCRTVADIRLDSIQRPDTTEGFCCYCRWMANVNIVDLASGMHHAGIAILLKN